MGMYDPKRLSIILEDLQAELLRWGMIAGDMIDTAEFAQIQTREIVNQNSRHSQIMISRIADDRDAYTSKRENVDALLLLCQETVAEAEAKLVEAQQTHDTTVRTHNHWVAELQKALEWLKRAEERLNRAIAWVSRAEAALQSAEREYSRARAAYDRCRSTYRTDEKGRRIYNDCSGYATAVERAASEVARAQNELQQAIAEYQAAKAEYDRALARVNCCKQATALTTQALEHSKAALERANSALSAAERALERALSAEDAINQALKRLEEEEEEGQNMLLYGQEAENSAALAHNNFMHATIHEESAQRYRTLTRIELDNKIALLNELNRPDSALGAYETGGHGSDRSILGFTGGNVSGISGLISAETSSIKEVKPPYDDIELMPHWLARVYNDGATWKVRLFDTSRRSKLPVKVAKGDGPMIDITLELDGSSQRAQFVGFHWDKEHLELAGMLLDQAESLSREQGASSVYFQEDRKAYYNDSQRKWYQNRGYTLSLEESSVLIYKVFFMEAN